MSSLHLNGFYFLKTVEFYMSLPNCLLNMIISQENLNGEPGGLLDCSWTVMPLCLILQWSCLDSSQSESSLSGFVPVYQIDPGHLTVRQKFHLCVSSCKKVVRSEAWCSVGSRAARGGFSSAALLEQGRWTDAFLGSHAVKILLHWFMHYSCDCRHSL